MAAAQVVLRTLHTKGQVQNQNIDVQYCPATGKKRVLCLEDTEERTFELPPCVPKAHKFHTLSTHPDRAAISVMQTDSAQTSRSSGEDKNIYYVHPEYKMPEDVTSEEHQREAPGTRLWTWNGEKTLHPFWAVRRMTREDLEKESSAQVPLAFNAELVEVEYTVMSLGAFQQDNVGITLAVKVPMMTNTVDLEPGQELIMEAAPKNKKVKRPISWKNDHKNQARAKAKAKAKSSPRQRAIWRATCGGPRWRAKVKAKSYIPEEL